MREVTVKIPEERFEFFMELFEQLGIETNLEYEIPEAHKAIVTARIKNSKPEDLIAWEEARKTLKFKT
ncbi:hypothetical protein [Mariniradius sediminis]|uniref:Addiction module component n=1 Tax=Mariniradius sediminis TaxID=2909237 RepID=A0ABS9BRH5_9BACT|nr:hypothetical protein [Mariniradius sediminis]MCF1750669.1 hypothetical protein [Mariniradius sediminis]